jgi:16S rRNA (cytosine1402-N4)-methyltransferase
VAHVPVLSEVLLERVKLPPNAVMIDATVGDGGHSILFGRSLGPSATLVGMDFDKKAVERASKRLGNLKCRVILLHANFSAIAEVLGGLEIKRADFILADLGLCSTQLDDGDMGLSFREDMPLDMRIDKSLKRTAADIVNTETEKNLADLIYRFGQERASRRIARFIVCDRHRRRIMTTGQLAAIVARALRRPKAATRPRIHPATRTFQALRIAVNDEIENLKGLLCSAPGLLATGGRFAVISYHSLEDGLVKQSFRQNAKLGLYGEITKKVIVPSRLEIARNRRARSAKLRIAVRA